MDTLKIYQEYKFKKGGSEFHISEGEGLKIKLSSGEILEGILTEVGGVSQSFDIDTENETITIDCEDVVDIIPI